jgi:dihydrofolate reductase
MQLDLIDEYQLCVQPIILGNGLRLFKDINDRINLKLIKTKIVSVQLGMKLYRQVSKSLFFDE